MAVVNRQPLHLEWLSIIAQLWITRGCVWHTATKVREIIKLSFIDLNCRIDEYHADLVQFRCDICHH